jgi:hypothetical protein
VVFFISRNLYTTLDAAEEDAVVLATRLSLKEPSTADPLAALNIAQTHLEQAFRDAGRGGDFILPAVTKIRGWLSRLRTQWQLSAGADAMHIGTLIDVLAGEGGALNAVCPDGNGGRACGVLAEAKTLLGASGNLAALIRTAARGDMREAGHLSVQAVFASSLPTKCEDNPTEACPEDAQTGPTEECPAHSQINSTEVGPADAQPGPTEECPAHAQIEMYRRFTDAVVMYVFDVVENGEPSAGATEAFRAAAVDVVMNVRGPSGFDRNFLGSFFAPGLGLRASWNAAYGTASGDSLRYVASVNWLTARVRLSYTSLTYTALHFSLVDPLAPLSELALRSQEDTSYRHNERLGWNVITPRAEILFGFPGFSRHLAVGAGASLRIVAPLPVDETGEAAEDDVDVFDYEYFPLRHHPFGESEWPRFIEFGFFAKYVI